MFYFILLLFFVLCLIVSYFANKERKRFKKRLYEQYKTLNKSNRIKLEQELIKYEKEFIFNKENSQKGE